MSKKAFFILCLITLFVFATAKFQATKKQTSSLETHSLLSFDLGAVKEVVLSSKDKKITLKESSADKWVSVSSNNYEAQLSKVNALLLKLHELKSNQKITSNPQNYARLGLGDTDKTALLLQDKEGKTLGSLLIGKAWETSQKNPMLAANGSAGRYVKAEPGEAVYLVSQDLTLSLEPNEWLNTQFLKVEKKDISSIQLLKTSPKLSIENSGKEAPTFALKGTQPGEKAKDWVVEQVADFFTNTNFSGVFSSTDPKLQKAAFQPLMDLKTKEGVIYHVIGGNLEKEFYLKISIEAAIPDGKKEIAQELKDKVVKLNDTFSPWIYKLESWVVATLNKSYKDMIEEAPKPKAENANPNTNNEAQADVIQTPQDQTPQDQTPEPGKTAPVPTLG